MFSGSAAVAAGVVRPGQLRGPLVRRIFRDIYVRAGTLADPRSEQIPESKLRVILTLAGLTPVPQYWISDRTGRLACVDLAFPEHKLAIEYDGD